MAVSKRLRYEIFRRDNHACRYCGASAPEAKLTVDHVIPVALGGTDSPSNLVTACTDCNAGKSASSPDAPIVADVEADALRWARALQQAADVAEANHWARMTRRDFFERDVWNTWVNMRGEPLPLPADWGPSIDRFWTLGLRAADFQLAVEQAMTAQASDEFRYMCGVLWNMVHDRQRAARDILAAEDANGS